MRLLVILLSFLAAMPAIAVTREELQREREAIEAEYAHRAQACKNQFVVTPCLDKVRIDKQKALSHVTSEENALNAAERQAKAEARQKRLADKTAASGDAPSAAPAASPSSATSASVPPPKAPKPPKPPKPPKAHQKPKPDRSAHEQQRRAAYEARQSEIEAHRQEVEHRNAERASKKSRPRPLPLPASAAGR